MTECLILYFNLIFNIFYVTFVPRKKWLEAWYLPRLFSRQRSSTRHGTGSDCCQSPSIFSALGCSSVSVFLSRRNRTEDPNLSTSSIFPFLFPYELSNDFQSPQSQFLGNILQKDRISVSRVDIPVDRVQEA